MPAADRANSSTAALGALMLLIGGGAHAAEPRCFEPQALAARPGEEHVVKGDRRFDRTPAAKALTPFAPLPPHLHGAVRRVDLPKGRKLVALTLDFCEQTGEIAGYDGRIVDYLRKESVKATLFLGGKWMRSHAERTGQMMTDPLFELANHAEAHRNLRLISGDTLRAEIVGPQQAYETLRNDIAARQCKAVSRTSPRLTLFRFPFGACNAASMAAVNREGLIAVQWDVSTGDPSPATTAQQIAATMIRQTRPGSIIIAHANGRGHNTAAALPLAIPKLKAMGFEFVTVSELLAAGKPVITDTCYDSRPGDTDRYDNLFARPKVTPNVHP